MFSSALVNFCLLAGLGKNRSTGFHTIRWKSGTWDRKKPLDCGGNNHVTLGLGNLGLGYRVKVTTDVPHHIRQDSVTVMSYSVTLGML